MPPKAHSVSVLFHPKKDTKKSKAAWPNGSPSSPKKSLTNSGAPSPKPLEVEIDEDGINLPEGNFQEFRLMSSALNGWKYDVMKFDSRKAVDISTWQAPIKLNRKDLKRDDTVAAGGPIAVGPMIGPDGKPVIGPDGRTVMVDAEGRPIHPSDEFGGTNGGKFGSDAKGKGAANAKKKFQKKTRQVFLIPDDVRQLRREEKHPWIMEDSSQREIWQGKLEEVSKAETHAFFMPAANDVFKFVPAHRWYKFQKKPNYHVPSLEEAESIMAKHQKNKDPERWLLHNRGKAASAATAAIFKAEAEGRSLSGGSSLVHNATQSLGPGGRRLRAVDSGTGLFGDDEEGEGRRRERELGEEGDLDEQEYEEDFADDDEQVKDDQDDDEAKELEERLKREYKAANKTREGYVDESEEEDDNELTRDGKQMKKLIRNLEKNAAYDSDEDKNPYASSEEEEEEEPPLVTNEPAIQQQPQQVQPRAGSHTPKIQRNKPPNDGSRATSPVPSGLGGHSIVAKRATSPKVPGPKLMANNTGRGASPLSNQPGVSSRATSPAGGSRATSPIAGGSGRSRAGSPVAQSPTAGGSKPTNKRKATDDPSSAPSPTNANGAVPKPKKRKPLATGAVPVGELEDRMVIDWLRQTPNASTRDCIQHFTPYLTDEEKKSKFTALVKEVAQLKGGILVLRNAYRAGGSAASTPTPA